MLGEGVKYVQLEEVLRACLRLQLCRVIRVAAAYDGRLFQQTRVDKEPLARASERSARHAAGFTVQKFAGALGANLVKPARQRDARVFGEPLGAIHNA